MSKLTIAVLAAILMCTGCTTAQVESSADRTLPADDDTYIPKDLDDSFVQLKAVLKPQDIEKMKAGTENDMIEYHLGLGMWMRNNWGLWGGSRLAKWFNAQGIKHPDDMSGIILDSFWRHLNKRPIKLDEQVKHYQDYWKKEETIQPEDPGDKQ